MHTSWLGCADVENLADTPIEQPGQDPRSCRPPPHEFRTLLTKLLVAHNLEVSYLEEEISRLSNQQNDESVRNWLEGKPYGRASEFSWGTIRTPRDEQSSQVSGISESPSAAHDSRFPRVHDAQQHHTPTGNVAALDCQLSHNTSPNPREVSFSSDGSKSVEEDKDGETDACSAEAAGQDDCEDEAVGQLGRGQYVWQWQRTKGGFRNYTADQNDQIEKAYQRGQSKVRIKSGQDGKTVMEIFFVDMVQLDPKSRNIRSVRRVGVKVWHVEWRRHAHAMARSIFHGGLRWESYEKYKKRQHGLLGIGEGEEEGDLSFSHLGPVDTFSSQIVYSEKADNICTRMTESSVFFVVAMLLTLLNLLWIGISTELGEFNQSLWNRGTESIIIEHIFTLYSIVEIVLQIMSMKHRSKCFFSPWFRLDAACTVAIVLEVLVAPHVPAAAGSLLAYQVLRLTRLAWLLKLTRARRAVGAILNGMASGMRSAADVWILIAVLLYTCGVLLTATSHRSEHLRERYFGSVGHTILSLLSHGVAMDGLSEFFNDLRAHHAIFEASVFATFVFLTYFGLLNMLVGVFL